MAIRIPWSDQEAAILLHALIDVIENRVERKAAVSAVSKELRELAIRNGIKIDDKFRNENGISLQMSKLEYVFTGGASGLSVETGWYFKIVDLYKNHPKQFESLLKEDTVVSSSEIKTMQDQYFDWLSNRVSPAQLSELKLAYDEIEKYFLSRKVLKAPLFQTTDKKILSKIRTTVEENKFFRMMHKRSLSRMSSAIRHYIGFMKETSDLESPSQSTYVAKIPAEDSKNEELVESSLPQPDSKREVASTTGTEADGVTAAVVQVQEDRDTGSLEPRQAENTVLDENQTEQDKSEIETVDLSDERTYAFTTPISFSFFGDITTVTNWRDLYINCIATLLEAYPSAIRNLRGAAIVGDGTADISDFPDPASMISPKKISDNVYVETNYNATNLMKRLRQLIVACNVGFENLQITFRHKLPSERLSASTVVYGKSDVQSISEVDEISKFAAWMLATGMAKASANGYTSSLKQVNEFAMRKHLICENVYLVTSVAELNNLEARLNADPEFVTYNTEKHHRFGSALRKYIEYRTACAEGTIKNTQQFKTEHIVPTITRENTVASVPQDIAQNYTSLLRDEFPDGMRQNIIHVKKFMQLYEERFGSIDATRDNLLDQLRQIGVVRDERIYPRQDSGQKSLTDEIYETIGNAFQNGGTCVYLSKILERYGQQLGEQLSIYNEDALQAILLERNSSNYLFRYGYICESAEKADSSSDVLRFMQSNHKAVNYDEIQAVLWYLPMDRIKRALVTTASLVKVDQETYFYAPNLPISSGELQTLARIMHEEISVEGFLVGKDLKRLIDKNCPSAAIDLADMKDWAIRNCLGYLLRDQFEFTGALISQKGHPLSAAEAYHGFCRQHETLTLGQLKEFSTEVNERINWRSVLSVMVRISPDKLIRADKIHFNVENTDEVLDIFCKGEYTPLKEIGLYLQFPPIEVPWNIFVLEYYLQQCSKKFRAIQPAVTQSGVYGVMSRRECAFHTYEEVVIDLLARNDTWNDKDTAVSYLISRGMQARTKLTNAAEIMKKALLLRDEIASKEK